MRNNPVFWLAAMTIATGASAQTYSDIKAPTPSSAYLQDSRGVIVRSASGQCWHTGYWTPADAVLGCDGELLPPINKITAPPIVAFTPATLAPAAPVAAAAPAQDFSVTLQSEQTFAFGKAILSATAKQRIDTEVISKLPTLQKVEIIVVTGHTDRIGSVKYNQKLSEQRAKAVAAYLKSKGISTQIETHGVAASEPVKQCSGKLKRTKLIECLAPDRRVVIVVKGTSR